MVLAPVMVVILMSRLINIIEKLFFRNIGISKDIEIKLLSNSVILDYQTAWISSKSDRLAELQNIT